MCSNRGKRLARHGDAGPHVFVKRALIASISDVRRDGAPSKAQLLATAAELRPRRCSMPTSGIASDTKTTYI